MLIRHNRTSRRNLLKKTAATAGQSAVLAAAPNLSCDGGKREDRIASSLAHQSRCFLAATGGSVPAPADRIWRMPSST